MHQKTFYWKNAVRRIFSITILGIICFMYGIVKYIFTFYEMTVKYIFSQIIFFLFLAIFCLYFFDFLYNSVLFKNFNNHSFLNILFWRSMTNCSSQICFRMSDNHRIIISKIIDSYRNNVVTTER